jgi:type VI secretion system protein ImpK
MNSKKDSFGVGGRTIIRSSPSRASNSGTDEPTPAPNGVKSARLESPGSTVFDPGVVEHPPPGWSSGTVFHQGAPFADEGGPKPDQADTPIRQAAEPARKVSQHALLNAADSIEYSAANPMIAAAAPLLMLFGNLRLMPVETQTGSLADHIAHGIREFERKIADAKVSEEDARIAKFVLCETTDDIIGNLPGLDREAWKGHSMLSQFFQAGPSGVGFFKALNNILADPERHCNLLELMHACLSLGFEGQYRRVASDDSNLERVRRDVYETLRYFRARPDEELSPRWQGLSEAMGQASARVPLWIIAAIASAVLTATFFSLRVFITNEGDALADKLLALNPPTPVVIERGSFVPLVEEVKVTTNQIDRVRAALAKDIESGGLTVGTKGDFIVVEINNVLLFQSGKADVKPEFEPVASRIAAALDPEPGPIKIVGHTDDVKPRKSSAFKSNHDLSVARAKAVEKAVAPKFSDPSRIMVEGKGEDEPIADNTTPDGRAKNRRVDVMIPREETL